MAGRIWIDVEDLFVFAEGHGRTPTGVQRLAFELCRALHARAGSTGRIGFVRQTAARDAFADVPWQEVDRLFGVLARSDAPTAQPAPPPPPPPPPPPSQARWRAFVRARLRPLLNRVPTSLRDPLVAAVRLQFHVVVALAFALLAALRPFRRARPAGIPEPSIDPAPPPPPPPVAVAAVPARVAAARWAATPGDVLFVVGAAWLHPDYAALLARAIQQHGVRVALLLYDIIPLRRPEWCTRSLNQAFRRWFHGVLPLCDTIFAISRASAEEATVYAHHNGLALRDAIRPIPVGTGFSLANTAPLAPGAAEALPAPGSYVLFVSTLEARKNHLLLFRVWRRLLLEMPDDQVPTLVFAGRIGVLVSDLMQQLRNCRFLDGRIVIVEHPSDAALHALYRGCLFTVFPSFYEGWGLPVTESLAFGKPCVIADRTSLPEAGQGLARMFDPDDVGGALRVIRATLEDRAGLAAWEAKVRREFRPVPWEASADAVLAAYPAAAA